jgi:hypothetical protein
LISNFEAAEPGHADAGQGRVRGASPVLRHRFEGGREVVFRG